jgi:hypothetical protein
MSVGKALTFFSERTISCIALYGTDMENHVGTLAYLHLVRAWWSVLGSRVRVTATSWPGIEAEMQRLLQTFEAMRAAAPLGPRCIRCNGAAHQSSDCARDRGAGHLSHELLVDLCTSLSLFLDGAGREVISSVLAERKANFCLARLGQDVVEGAFGIARGSCGQAMLTVSALDVSLQRQRALAVGEADGRGVSPRNGRQVGSHPGAMLPLRTADLRTRGTLPLKG